jgi:hypothetical protein
MQHHPISAACAIAETIDEHALAFHSSIMSSAAALAILILQMAGFRLPV